MLKFALAPTMSLPMSTNGGLLITLYGFYCFAWLWYEWSDRISLVEGFAACRYSLNSVENDLLSSVSECWSLCSGF